MKYRNVISLVIFGASNVLQRGMTTLLALIYATQMPPEHLGIYALVLGVAEVAGILSDAGLSQAVVRNYFDRHDEDDILNYVTSTLLTARLIALFTMLVIGIITWFLWDVLTAGEVPRWPFFVMAFAIAFFNRIALMMDGLCKAMQKPYEYGLFTAAQALSTIAFAVLFVWYLDLGVAGALAAIVAAMIVGNLVRVIVMSRVLKPGRGLADRATIRSLLAYGVPLIPKQLAIWGRQMALRLVLAQLFPIAAVGAFFFANAIASTLQMVGTALESVLTPVYLKQRVAEVAGFSAKMIAILRVLLLVMLILCLSGILLVPTLAPAFLPKGYELSLPLIPLLFANCFFQSQEAFMSKQLIFHRRTGLLSMLTVGPIIAGLALLPLVTPYFGLEGAAFTMIAANICVLAFIQIAVTRIEPSDYPISASVICGVIVCAMAVTVQFYPSCELDIGEIVLRCGIVLVIGLPLAVLWLWPQRALLFSAIRK